SSPIIPRRAEKLGIKHVHLGVMDKAREIERIVEARGITAEQVAYIGDDVNDLTALEIAGLSACPADAEPAVRAGVHKTLPSGGGRGALRELAEIILESRARNDVVDADFNAQPLRLVDDVPSRWRAVGRRAIGDGEPVYVIAEIGINHNGS